MAAADANGEEYCHRTRPPDFLQSAGTEITCQQLDVGRAGMISLPCNFAAVVQF
jgi:hypothetical protein